MKRKVKLNPPKFERCVSDVKSSLKKQHRSGNAYAICTAAGTRINKLSDTRRRKSPKTASRSNPSEYDAAGKQSAEFHGTEPQEDFVIETEVFEHSNLADAGELVCLRVRSINGGIVWIGDKKNRLELAGWDGARLCMSPKGYPPQLFIEGGNQEVDLSDFDISNPHESEVLGWITHVTYYTTKHHLGRDGGEANYKHQFGELGALELRGNQPMLIYDTINKTLSISGGDYTILREGIDN